VFACLRTCALVHLPTHTNNESMFYVMRVILDRSQFLFIYNQTINLRMSSFALVILFKVNYLCFLEKATNIPPGHVEAPGPVAQSVIIIIIIIIIII
jgi:hypothetical protein